MREKQGFYPIPGVAAAAAGMKETHFKTSQPKKKVVLYEYRVEIPEQLFWPAPVVPYPYRCADLPSPRSEGIITSKYVG